MADEPIVYVVRGADQTAQDGVLIYTADEFEKAVSAARELSRERGPKVVVPATLTEEGKVVYRFENGEAVPPG